MKPNLIRRYLFMTLIFAVMICQGVVASAQTKKIILFHEDALKTEVGDYVSSWTSDGAVLEERIPFIRGIIMTVPDTITNADLAGDWRVDRVMDDQEIYLQSLPAPRETDMDAGEPIRFVKPLRDNVFEDLQRPWGVLSLYNQSYHPDYPTGLYDPGTLLRILTAAKNKTYLQNIRIAVFDTGIDMRDNIGRFAQGGEDFIHGVRGLPADDNGHGTHVAATIAGPRMGVAKNVQIYILKVLDRNAEGRLTNLVKAFKWAINHDMDIINMSLAYSEDNPAVRLAVQKAHEAGIVMVAAVGNHSNWEDSGAGSGDGGSGDGGSGEGGAGDDDDDAAAESDSYSYPVMFPAAYPEVIAVGAHDSYGALAPFSNTGEEMDLMAPGTNVASANLSEVSRNGLCSGTSMATPHVTASVALMLSLDANLNADLPRLTPDEVKAILVGSLKDGKLNLVGALRRVRLR